MPERVPTRVAHSELDVTELPLLCIALLVLPASYPLGGAAAPLLDLPLLPLFPREIVLVTLFRPVMLMLY